MRPSLGLLLLVAVLLLLRCGDVKPNPGPTFQPLSICHINARSLCPSDRSKRIDEIQSILALDEKFDLICVSETMLYSRL